MKLLTELLLGAVIALPSISFAGSLTASPAASTHFKPATISPQTQPATALAPGQQQTSGFFPVMRTPNLPAAAQGVPVTAVPVQVANAAPQNNGNQQNAAQQLLQQLMQAMNGGANGGLPNRNTNWNTFEYDDNHIWESGKKGIGNIGNGLCTKNNLNRSQVKKGFCHDLYEILNDPNSCAHREMNKIIAMADQNSFGQMHDFCSTYPKLTEEQKPQMFLQILAGLAVAESGWDPGQVEPGWYRDGKQMQGRGTFQLGVADRTQDPDCSQLDSSTIYDPKINMRCGACIALKFAAADHTMGRGTNDYNAGDSRTARGIARYYGPFRNAQSAKREAIASGANAWCVANTSDSPNPGMLAAIDAPGSNSVASTAQRTTASAAK